MGTEGLTYIVGGRGIRRALGIGNRLHGPVAEAAKDLGTYGLIDAAIGYTSPPEESTAGALADLFKRQAARERERRDDGTVKQFRQEMSEHVRSAYPQLADLPNIGQLTERAFQSYGAHLDMEERKGHSVTLDRQEFIQNHLRPAFLSDPQVRARLQRARGGEGAAAQGGRGAYREILESGDQGG